MENASVGSVRSLSSLLLTPATDPVMSQYLLLWILLSVLALLLVCCRCTVILYVLAVIPAVLVVLFLLLKHSPVTGPNRLEFFRDFVYGGHRGSPTHAPENSVVSLEKAVEEGAQLVEFDIQLSSDGVPILMHDDDTGRVAETKLTVSESPVQQLLETSLKPVNRVSAKVASLEQAVAFCKENKTKMIFDVKSGNPKLLNELVRVIQEHKLHSLVIVSSFDPWVSYYLKWVDRGILTGFTNRRGLLSTASCEVRTPKGAILWQWALELADSIIHLAIETFLLPRFLGVDMLLLNHCDISIELVNQAKDYEISVVSWTVNDTDEMKWMKDIAKIPFLTDEPFKMIKGQ